MKVKEILSPEAKIKQENRLLKSKVFDLEKELQSLQKTIQVLKKIENKPITLFPFPPVREKTSGHVTALVLFSDTHFDEVVDPSAVMGKNAYNRSIALLRVEEFVNNLIKLSKDYTGYVKYDGLVLAMLGDILSGTIHEDLRETNEKTIIDSVLFWSGVVASMIKTIYESLELPMYIPCVVGNHGRLTEKRKVKNYTVDNFDFLLYKLVESEVNKLGYKIKMDISLSTSKVIKIYNSRILLTHGDDFRGGSGISGNLTPLSIGFFRKGRLMQSLGDGIDYMAVGHFHERSNYHEIMMNGTMKGMDEYTFSHGYAFQEPMQSFILFDPIHQQTITAPIFCKHPKERW